MKRLNYFIIPLLVLLIHVELQGQSFLNPFSNLPDPSITYRNGYYYMTGTTGASVALKKSRTLEGLKGKDAAVVFSTGNSGAPCCNWWAPEILFINNKWYIYFTAGTSNDINMQRTYCIENSSADPTTGTWVFKGKVASPGADYYSIDATVFSLNGLLYMVWSGHLLASDPFDAPQRLYISRMSDPWTLTGSRTLISSATLSWEGNNVNEGPEVIIRNGKVFLVYSTNHCSTPNYSLGMLSMNQTADPLNASNWYKHPNPVFTRNDALDIYGPGHHGFFTSPDGTEDWFIYHATTSPGGGCDNTRTTRAQRLYWNPDGTPNFGRPVATAVRWKAPSGEPAVPALSPIANGVYRFIAKHSGQVMDLAGCSPTPATNIQTWTWLNNLCQRFYVQATEDGYYTIQAMRGGLVLDVDNCSMDNGANVKVYTPGGNDCQKWSFVPTTNGYYRIVSKRSGKVLDVAYGGNNIQQWDWLGYDNQQFLIEAADNTTIASGNTFNLINANSNKAMEVAGYSTTNGGNVQQWDYVGAASQKWTVTDVGGGAYKFVNVNSNKAMEVGGFSLANGGNIQQWDYVGAASQKWQIIPNPDGTYAILSIHNGKSAEVSGFSTANGGNVQQWDYTGVASQKWKFTQVSAAGGVTSTAVETFDNTTIQLSPNPVDAGVEQLVSVHFTADAGDVRIQLLDINGADISSTHYKAVKQKLDMALPALTRGMYLVKISGRQHTEVRKLIIK
jgi:GH43 family beta-xylosidase